MSQPPKDYVRPGVSAWHMDHKLHIFIDESGDLGQYGSKYFSIVALSTQAVDNLNRIIKRVRQRKLRKKLKELPELKANSADDPIRKIVLRKVAQLDCSISVVVVPKSMVREDLFRHKEKLYNYLCGLLFKHITLSVESVDITIDKKHNNRLLREDFNQYIERKIRSRVTGVKVMIRHLESHTSNALQAVDFVAWAMNRKFSFDNSTFYDLIVSKIENAGRENPWNGPPRE